MGRRPKEEIIRLEPEPTPEPVAPAIRRRRRQLDEAATHLALVGILTETRLRRKADARSWQLGEEYIAAGAVTELETSEGRVTGKVRGSSLYAVQLSLNSRNDLDYDCNCPRHQDSGDFCKHLVALGLAYLRRNADSVEEVAVPKGSAIDTIQKHLAGLTKEQLITLLMAQSLENEPLRRHLLWLAKPTSEPARPRLVFKPASD
jgi:uncharacterized Zn finger protein